MKFIRKALLPTVIAATFLGFLGAVGSSAAVVYDTDGNGVTNTTAGPGDVCRIEGPTFLQEGETADYTAYIHGILDIPLLADFITEDLQVGPEALLLAVIADGVTTDVNLDDSGGDSDITSVDKDGDGDTEAVPPTDHLNAVEMFTGTDVCTDDEEVLAEIEDVLSELIEEDVIDCVQGLIGSCDVLDWTTPVASGGNADNLAANNITPTRVAVMAAAEILDGASCAAMAEEVEDDLVDMGVGIDVADRIGDGSEDEEPLIDGDLLELCEDGGWDVLVDLLLLLSEDRTITVDVTCNDAGTFDLSFAPEWSIELGGLVLELEDFGLVVGDALAIHVRCGSDVDHATITALPTTVETNPSIANVAHSLVYVVLFDDDDDNALPGDEVHFMTDRCSIEASAVDNEEEFEAAEALFRNAGGAAPSVISLNPAAAAAIESSVYANTAPDGASRQQEEVNSFVVTGSAATNFAQRTVAAVILHCDPIHAPGVTPGPAVVTAIIERGDDEPGLGDIDNDLSDNDDLVLKTTVTVVGPPAANGLTVTAAPATLACGEKATLDITVKDSIGQNVSDHTFVEIVTNAGGVLAGTGAVAGQAGLVSPVSSTVAETFGGKVTAYLLTSTQHVGKYEVVVTTGGGGGVTGQLQSGGVTTNLLGGLFTTQPISVQVTVECTVPAAPVNVQVQVPDTTGPRTGQGITPPSTGDAGLASTESNWVVGAVAAVVASLVIAGFAVKLVRDEN